MRQILHGDLTAAARVLRTVAPAAREGLLLRMIAEAEVADRYRRRLGRVHPRFGDGSLMAAALRRRPRPEPFLSDSDYLCCLGQVIAALLARRNAPAVFSSAPSFRMMRPPYLV